MACSTYAWDGTPPISSVLPWREKFSYSTLNLIGFRKPGAQSDLRDRRARRECQRLSERHIVRLVRVQGRASGRKGQDERTDSDDVFRFYTQSSPYALPRSRDELTAGYSLVATARRPAQEEDMPLRPLTRSERSRTLRGLCLGSDDHEDIVCDLLRKE